MAAFSYNPSSSESYRSQYNRYLQNQNYVSQIDNAIRETGNINAAIAAVQSREVQNAIHASSQEVKDAIYDTVSAICYDLEYEFENLNSSLHKIRNEIHDLADLMGHGFSLVLEGQKITHQYLGRIQNLLRIPDSQKQRVYHIEEGMKYLRNAFRESPDSEFYTDALEEFKKSEAIERKDFFSLYHIGFIYLKSTKHLDEVSAEKYFRNAARYYLAEAMVSGTNVSNNLLSSNIGFLIEAVEAYLFAAEACYLQQKFSEAAQLASEAWKILPGFLKAGFIQSKYLAANNQPSDAAKVLGKVIEADRYFSMEVLSELDLISKPEIQDLLEEFRQEAFEEASVLLSECKKNMIDGSVAEDEVAAIESLISKKSFLHCKKAIDRFLLSKRWTINAGANISDQGEVIAKISPQEFSGTLFDFVKFEKERVLALPTANNLIEIEKIEKQKDIFQKEIEELKDRIKHNNYRIYTQIQFFLKYFGVAVIVTIIHFSLGLSEKLNDGGLLNLIILPLMLIIAITIGLSSGVALYTLVYLIKNSIETPFANMTLNSEILKKKAAISRLKIDISRLNEDIKKLQ